MIKKISGVVFFGVLLGLTACSSTQSHGMKKDSKEFKARSVIFFNSEGKMVAMDVNGKELKPCSVKPGEGQCRALSKEAEIRNVQPLTLIQSKINPNYLVIFDANGIPYEIPW